MVQNVTQSEKDLLSKDLSARLPYGVKLQNVNNEESIVKLYSINLDDSSREIKYYTYEGKALTICDASKLLRCGKFLRYKPYLFPLSSMTEEQRKEYEGIIYKSIELHYQRYYDVIDIDDFDCLMDFYHKNHFDYRGLIPMGLAKDATGLNIY